MLDPGLVSFVTDALPSPPARVLEIGAGSGELATHVSAAGHDVVAIDPASDGPPVRRVSLHELDEPDASFDAALAVVSLHHVEPLTESCERLARMLRPDATLVIDEFDIGALNPAAMRWWLARNPGHAAHARSPESIVEEMQSHLHPLTEIVAALDPWFELGPVERIPYLYRWELGPALRPDEERAIARGEIPATGARLVGRRSDNPLRTARFLANGMVRPDLVEIFDRFAAGDEAAIEAFRPLLDRLDPEVIWDATELDVPDGAAVVHGPAAIMEFFRNWLAAWSSFAWTTSNFEVRGDDVVYDVHITAVSRHTGLALDQHVTHRMTIRDGKLVAWRLFQERRDALARD